MRRFLSALSISLLVGLPVAMGQTKVQDSASDKSPAADKSAQVATDKAATQPPLDRATTQVATEPSDTPPPMPAAPLKSEKELKKEKEAADKAAREAAKEEERLAKQKKKNPKKDTEAIGDRDVGKGVNFYSIEKEIAMGKSYAQEIERQAKIVDDPVIAEYINRVGQNLVRNSDAKVPFTIKVIDAEEVNAFALPGGFFYINTGLIMRADNEAELAGVMAHEIAHVAARHSTRQQTRGQIANLATLPLIFMGGGWGMYGARQAVSVLLPMAFLKFSRGFEREADLLGLQYMYKTGYDPTAVVDFFEKLQSLEKKKPGTMAKVFGTHPLTDDRIKDSQTNIQEILAAKPEYVLNRSEFNDVKTRLSMLQNRRKVDDKDANRPRLRRTPGTGTIDAEEKDKKKQEEEDERPTLKRRPSGE